MGMLSKLGLKKKKHRTGEKKYEDYESVDLVKQKTASKRGDPRLVIGDAPKAPRFGGKGLADNTVYTYEDNQEADQPVHEHQKRRDEGAAALPAFGTPPAATSAKPDTTSHATDEEGKSNAQSAMDAAVDTHVDAQKARKGEKADAASEPASGSAPIGEATPDPVVPAIPERPGIVVNIMTVLKVALGVYLLFLALFTAWLRPTIGALFWSISVGCLLGLGYSLLFFRARYVKRLINSGFNVSPGRKGMVELLGQVPSWVSFQDKEKVEWANLMVKQMWQFYDKAIGDTIKEAVEPIMDQYKPAGIVKRIYFKRITFGDAPITIDDVWLENEGEKHVLMEMAFRLQGDGNIEVAVELGVGGDATRIVTKITDLHISGVMRVILAPLVPEIPCFGAAVISLKRPPLIHFTLDFGRALGGGLTAKGVKMWLDPFLRDTLGSMLVWPNRLVFPILPESPVNNLEELMLKNVGLLQVTVVEARDLHKQDWLGKADPLVQCWTQHNHLEETKHAKKTLNPTWNEDFHLLVQEPKTQFMRLQMYDWDGVDLKHLMTNVNIVKGIKGSVGAKTFMGRAAVEIRPFLQEPGKVHDRWYELGKNEWSHEDGTGKGHGSVRLKLCYYPFSLLYSKPRKAKQGAVLVSLKKAEDLPAADSNGLSDPYAIMRIGGKEFKSTIKYDTLTPVWDEKYEFIKVPANDVLRVEVWDDDPVDPDDKLGIVEINIEQEVAPAPSSTVIKKYFLRDVPKDLKTKEVKRASINLGIQWVPFDFSSPQDEEESK